jgi:hypothetical protein
MKLTQFEDKRLRRIKGLHLFNYVRIDDDVIATDKTHYLVDCRAKNIVITLPTTPSDMFIIGLNDDSYSIGNYNITIRREDEDSAIGFIKEDLVITNKGVSLNLLYNADKNNWSIL